MIQTISNRSNSSHTNHGTHKKYTPGFAVITAELTRSGIWAKLKDRHRNVLTCVLSFAPNMHPSINRLMGLSGCGRTTVVRALNELNHIGLLTKENRYKAQGNLDTNWYTFTDLKDPAVVKGILSFLDHEQFWLVTSILYAGGKKDSIGIEVITLLSPRGVISSDANDPSPLCDDQEVVSDGAAIKKTSIRDIDKEHADVGITSDASCSSNPISQSTSNPDTQSLTATATESTSAQVTDSGTTVSAQSSNLATENAPESYAGKSYIDPGDGTKRYISSDLPHQLSGEYTSRTPRGINQTRLDNQIANFHEYLANLKSNPLATKIEQILSDEADISGCNLEIGLNLVCRNGYSLEELRALITDTKKKSTRSPQGLLMKRLEDGDRIRAVGFDESNPAHVDTKERVIEWLEERSIVKGGQRSLVDNHIMALIDLQSHEYWANDILDEFCRDFNLDGYAPPGVVVARLRDNLSEYLQEHLSNAVAFASADAKQDQSGVTD